MQILHEIPKGTRMKGFCNGQRQAEPRLDRAPAFIERLIGLQSNPEPSAGRHHILDQAAAPLAQAQGAAGFRADRPADVRPRVVGEGQAGSPEIAAQRFSAGLRRLASGEERLGPRAAGN